MPIETKEVKESDLDKLAAITVSAESINLNIGHIKSIAGQSITISPIRYKGFIKESESTITIPTAGIWYVGFDLYSKEIITLPRNLHRGWLCVAEVISDGISIISVKQVELKIHKSRIQRAMTKILNGTPDIFNVGIMGSSLAESSGTSSWAGMLFDMASSTMDYKIPLTTSYSNLAVGGTPNKYQLAQTGLITKSNGGAILNSSSFSSMLEIDVVRNGRSPWFMDKDLIVITCLANGGSYRLEAIEPIFRNLKKLGLEVIVCSDNAQNPILDYTALSKAALYVDGTELEILCNKYGFEFADTAAYMFDSYLRGYSVYGDAIHPSGALPNGPLETPSCGREVWARAIRSLIPVVPTPSAVLTKNYNFNNNEIIDAAPNSTIYTSLTIVNNALVVKKITSAVGQWGAQYVMPPMRAGDTIKVTATLVSRLNTSASIQIGTQGGGSGWGSNIIGLGTDGGTIIESVITCNRDILTGGKLYFFAGNDSAPLDANFILDDITIVYNSSYQALGIANIDMSYEFITLPRHIVRNKKFIGDAIVVLPEDEPLKQGTLSSSYKGASSFARQLSPTTLSTNDSLHLSAGKRASISGHGVVSIAMVFCNISTDAPVTFNVYRGGVLATSTPITLSTFYSRENFWELLPQDIIANSIADPISTSYEIEVVSGVLKLSALIAYTFEIEYIPTNDIKFIGTGWSTVPAAGGSGMQGIWTNTLNNYAYVDTKNEICRAYFLLSCKSGSKPVNIGNNAQLLPNINTTGVSHIRPFGGLIGAGKTYIKLMEASTTDNTNGGYGVHIGGAILVKDR